MTKPEKVFCKGCNHYVILHESVFSVACTIVDGRDPITGELDKMQSDCRIKNINCNCPDYEPKEGVDE